jgi:hypothetical protein
MTKQAASPAATGSGSHFEAKVGAFYLLAMLLDAEPRGLPGARIDRIQLQGAEDGFPLDDVIVHATMPARTPAVAEIQVKRKITFSSADTVFRDVAEQIVEAIKAGKLEDPNPQPLAIATAQSSRQIDGAYQAVLLWARHSESAEAFFRKLGRPGASNESMRTFVATLRANVAHFGAASEDETIWKILRRLQILVFDFSADHGQTECLVRDRCAQALDPSECGEAGALWSALCDIAQSIATSGGEIAAPALRNILTNTHGLRLAGLRQNRAALAALLEASQNALHDIRYHVGPATLSRRARLDSVNAALDSGRYVEILGDAGVGKSGILRALAEQTAMGANIIALSPTRTIPRGWLAMRQALRFDGSAKDLLSEIAASGGGTLFVDSVDFFGDAERATVSDLVRQAAAVPGFNVIVTGRRSFGTEEPNWLPDAAINKLGRAPVIIIDELTDTEIEELQSAAPELAPLLANAHPARDVVRNLFRLDRLLRQARGDPVPRTEAEMAKLRWQTGDGKNDDQARERTRILRSLADKSLSGDAGPLDTSTYPAIPLNALVKNGALRDLSGEKMIFRHDVFRDWAVANLLDENSAKIAALPLTRPAPASLSRGVELAARLAIEGSPDAKPWKALLDRFSQTDVHGSWCRAVVITLVRSELSTDVLTRAEEHLLADSGRLLRDLVRSLMALDVAPASQLLAGYGVNLPDEIAGLSIPIGPTWRRLVVWILGLKDRLPANVIPNVAELYTSYASAALMFDPIVPDLVAQLHAWLMEIERDQADRTPGRRPALSGGLGYEKRQSLHEYLRSSFLALSIATSHLADQYVRFILKQGHRAHYSAESILKSPGNLAQAASGALAELTAATLIEREAPRRQGFVDYGYQEAFTDADRQLLLPSPARGPFLDLLVHSPIDGLALVRQIVQHACTFGRGRSQPDDDAIIIELESGPRRFPSRDTYYWSRDAQGQYCVTSALMALEAWGHRRIDAGESVETVIADVFGNDEVPAAYLLVIVDLLLSHWPKSQKAAIPFVGSPDLLSFDRTRQIYDSGAYDFGMLGEQEPRGLANRDSLKKRASRGRLLEQVLPFYLFGEQLADGDAVRARLESAATRLGPYEARSTMADPRLMVVYALNHLDRQNYRPRVVQDETGNAQTFYEYVSPTSEANHLAPMQSGAAAQMAGLNLRSKLAIALENSEKSSPDLIARAIAWAREIDVGGEPQPNYDHSVLISAALVMRDGNTAQRKEHGAWAKSQFRTAIARAEDPVHRHRDGLRFNPVGIAAVGMVAAVRRDGGLSEARPLLDLAVTSDPAAAHGFGAEMNSMIAIDPLCRILCCAARLRAAFALA